MTNLTHASIIPLIGGETIGSERAFGHPPEFIMSYTPFMQHDAHILNWYDNSIPYFLIDQGQIPTGRVDVISSVCPCAGLSMMSHGYGDHNQNNKWLIETTEFVLSTMRPAVFWGENAPAFAGKIGHNIRENMRQIAESHGYSMSVYRTKSILHGLSQVRERSFYFFWRGDRVPVFGYFNRPYEKIEDTIFSARGNSLQEPINPKIPSRDDSYYKYVLEEIHGGITHRQFFDTLDPLKVGANDIISYIERIGVDYADLSKWFRTKGNDKEADKCLTKKAKLESGKNIMRRGTVIPKDHIGAFVGHYPTMLTHPREDRYITYREAMTIMGLPQNFELLNPKKNANHICQNVPVQTAQDMAEEVVAVLEGKREWIDAKYVFQRNHDQSVIVGSRGKVESTPSLESYIS